MDGRYLSKTVHEALQELAPLPVKFEELPDKAASLPCFSMQTLTGDPVFKRYKDGSYIGNYRFAVYLRQSGVDTALRLDAVGALTDLASAIEALRLSLEAPYEFRGIRGDTLPTKITVAPEYDDWQATFTMTYRKERKTNGLQI
jgi:hypothetical protein